MSNFKDLTPEQANARRNEIGNYMREYVEDVYPQAGKRARAVIKDENGNEQIAETFLKSRDELFDEPREQFAQNFMERLRSVDGIDADVVARVERAIPYLDDMKDQMDGLIGKAADMKMDMTQLIDSEITYFPLQRQTSKGVMTGRFGSKLKNLEPDNPFAIRRKDYLRNIPGGTAVLNRMSTDAKYAGRGSKFARNTYKYDQRSRQELLDEFRKDTLPLGTMKHRKSCLT